MDYATIKSIHVGSVAVSYLLFVARGVWMIRDSPLLARRAVKILPHVVDTVLLLSAITLAVLSHQYPVVSGWLNAKIIGLAIYIALGTLALKRGKSKRARIGAWIAAQAVFGYIVMVAITRHPLGALR